MIAAREPARKASPSHLVSEILEELTRDEITLELATPEEEPQWNRLVRKHHYLKEDRLVGESLRYIAQQRGKWIALLGWSSAAFHLRPRLDRRGCMTV